MCTLYTETLAFDRFGLLRRCCQPPLGSGGNSACAYIRTITFRPTIFRSTFRAVFGCSNTPAHNTNTDANKQARTHSLPSVRSFRSSCELRCSSYSWRAYYSTIQTRRDIQTEDGGWMRCKTTQLSVDVDFLDSELASVRVSREMSLLLCRMALRVHICLVQTYNAPYIHIICMHCASHQQNRW